MVSLAQANQSATTNIVFIDPFRTDFATDQWGIGRTGPKRASRPQTPGSIHEFPHSKSVFEGIEASPRRIETTSPTEEKEKDENKVLTPPNE